jgi:phosphate starvation-inducible protein PhoH and related proteins
MSKRKQHNNEYASEAVTEMKTGIKQFKQIVVAKNEEQKEFMKTMSQNIITFVKGAPGTGKSFLAVTYGLQRLFSGKVKQLIFTRPAVEAAGEKLGYLPGDLSEKINPYMVPLFDALTQIIPIETLDKLMRKNGNEAQIKIVPLAYMRGMNFANSFILADEMQSSGPEQMRMLLTRIAENSQMVITGDVEQSDISGVNGLQDAFNLLQGIDGIGFMTLTEQAIVRHPIIQKVEERYHNRFKKIYGTV